MCQKENITMKHEVVLHFFWQGSLMMATLTKLLDHSWITWISTQSCRNDYIHSRSVTPERLPTQRFPNYRPIPTVGYSGAICSFWKVHKLMWWFSNNCRLSACETNPEWKKVIMKLDHFSNQDWIQQQWLKIEFRPIKWMCTHEYLIQLRGQPPNANLSDRKEGIIISNHHPLIRPPCFWPYVLDVPGYQ